MADTNPEVARALAETERLSAFATALRFGVRPNGDTLVVPPATAIDDVLRKAGFEPTGSPLLWTRVPAAVPVEGTPATAQGAQTQPPPSQPTGDVDKTVPGVAPIPPSELDVSTAKTVRAAAVTTFPDDVTPPSKPAPKRK